MEKSVFSGIVLFDFRQLLKLQIYQYFIGTNDISHWRETIWVQFYATLTRDNYSGGDDVLN